MENKVLQRLKDRYFRPVIAHPDGHLGHHGDCNIYSHEYKHCDCGLIHDLDRIHFADKLYANYFEDYRASRGLKAISKEEQKKASDLLDQIFAKEIGRANELNQSFHDDEKNEAFREWTSIEEVFGSGFRQRREKEWAEQSEKI